MATETEIKFPVENHTLYTQKLQEFHAATEPETFEDSIVFDDSNHTLYQKGYLLRLRKSDKITLTFKKPLEKSQFKVMEEYEIEVSDFIKTETILKMLGYERTFRYQKRRKTFALQGALITFDETPIGNFIEIEGEKEKIKEIAGLLNLPMENGTSKTYMELYIEYCKMHNLIPADMVFEM